MARYPVWLVQREAQFAREHVDRMIASNVIAMQAMVASLFGNEESHSRFKRLIDRLQG